MNYVEWLRVRNALRIYAVVLGALILIALIVRISVNGQLSNNKFIVNHIEHDPGTVISHSVVNGLNRTTLVNAKDRTTITMDRAERRWEAHPHRSTCRQAQHDQESS